VTSEHPSYEQLVVLPAFSAQGVPTAFEDINGHLNVRHYVGIASEGLDAEHHLTYLSELRTGDRISVRVRLVGRSARAAHAVVYLLDDTHHKLSCVVEEIFLHLDMGTRRTAPWPEDVAKGLDGRIAEHQALPWQPGLSGSMALR
jgi:acyl-CoA thioester hydrolase